MNNAICPISDVKCNEYAARIVSFTMMSGALAYIFTESWYVLAVMALDFFLRCFLKIPQSPASWFVAFVFRVFKLPNKPKDKAPKVFAARFGFALMAFALVFHFLNPLTAQILAMLLAVLAFMDSILNYCVGCVIYSKIVLKFFSAER